MLTVSQSSGLELKFEEVELTHSGVATRGSFKSLHELETMRSSRRAVPASKYGLEAICGASCDTAAN